ncbi:4-hydroxy-3-methylbut-2-en-1-yl diphosphate synthase [Paracoccus acridae]|uniref:4-hydroxy-3-methylbut-2-en-1-yl diphosphate synthase n=1 Tax=Paracoccus acridae TaxID=1795310 RepID=A0ABQ1VIN6_9RHOB|nr:MULTISPECIES: RodZ domain-containing protein [Paracoccus]GGF70179.1 4-hydroxy-3-methylbut-2-en-1-yl diphosphate synthase [Paracoccus acridae]
MSRLRAENPAEEISQVEEVHHFLDDDTRLGDIMRGERATLGKSLLDVQRELRIRASYVAAIENCDITAFDAPSFVSGYVRSYARYLGMDPDWTFRRFCLESGFQPTHGMAQAAAGPKPLKRPSDPVEALANPKALFIPQQESFWSDIEPRAVGAVLVLIALVCGLGYGGWAVLQEVQRVTLTPGENAPGVVTALDPVEGAGMAEPALDLSDTTDLAQALPQPEGLDRLYRPQILEAPVLTARDGPIAAIDPGLTSVPAPTGEAQAVPETATAIQRALAEAGAVEFGPAMPEEAAAAITVAPDAPALELLAARPAWVRVTSADGTVLLEKIMDAGERFTLPALEEPPLLRTGNSGAVYFAVNGQTFGPAAPGPQVVKNIKLSPEEVTGSFALADLNADPELAQLIAVAQATPVTDAQTTTE